MEDTSINQLFLLNNTSNATSTTVLPNPFYEVFEIPGTDLILHLAILLDLDPLAMQSCLRSASIWIGFRRQSDPIPNQSFEWKDPAGAVFSIRQLSQQLAWQDLSNVLRGLKEDLEDRRRYYTTSFTVQSKSTELFIAQGRLSRYKAPQPTATPSVEIATS